MKSFLVGLILIFAGLPGVAQRMPSHCIALSERAPSVPIRLASTQLAEDEVHIEFLGHSMYRLETFGGVSAVTDYSGGVRPVPTVVTMNHAHSSHWTSYPEPEIEHVLHGWGKNGEKAKHRLELDEMLVRNITTDIRSRYTGIEPDGNSIFIFEVAGMCVAHLGHLHHEPSEEQYAQMGRLDIVMAAFDGGQSLDAQTMIRVMKRVRASVVLPMHWWGRGSIDAYLTAMKDDFVIDVRKQNGLVMSLDLLPIKPSVIVMPPFIQPSFDE